MKNLNFNEQLLMRKLGVNSIEEIPDKLLDLRIQISSLRGIAKHLEIGINELYFIFEYYGVPTKLNNKGKRVHPLTVYLSKLTFEEARQELMNMLEQVGYSNKLLADKQDCSPSTISALKKKYSIIEINMEKPDEKGPRGKYHIKTDSNSNEPKEENKHVALERFNRRIEKTKMYKQEKNNSVKQEVKENTLKEEITVPNENTEYNKDLIKEKINPENLTKTESFVNKNENVTQSYVVSNEEKYDRFINDKLKESFGGLVYDIIDRINKSGYHIEKKDYRRLKLLYAKLLDLEIANNKIVTIELDPRISNILNFLQNKNININKMINYAIFHEINRNQEFYAQLLEDFETFGIENQMKNEN